MARTEVGSAYVSIYPDTSTFVSDLESELGGRKVIRALSNAGNDGGEASSKGFSKGFSAVTVALGQLGARAVEGAMNLVSSNVDRGIQRLDTIKNFPKLMQTFGYSTEEADASVRAIQEHLDGLPGSTDEVLRLVQSISDSTSSLSLATSTGLAFNDMLTAAGADATTAAYATSMFDQMMGGAAYSSQRWQGIVSKMPLQMGLVAEHMLGAGATTAQLGDALEDGTVSMEDLAQAMTDLSPQFEEQARAMSYGIGTAMENVKNRVAQGIADILDRFGQENIAQAIDTFSYGFRDGLVAVGDTIEWLLGQVRDSGLVDQLGRIWTQLGEAFSSIDFSFLQDVAAGAIQALADALKWVADNGERVQWLLATLAGALMPFLALGIAAKVGALTGALSALWGVIAANPMMAAISIISALVAAIVWFFTQTEEGRQMWADFTSFLATSIENARRAIAEAVYNVVWAILKFANDCAAAWETLKKNTMEMVDSVVKWWEDMKAGAVRKAREIAQGARQRFEELRASVKRIFAGVKRFMEDPLGTAKTAILNIAKAIGEKLGFPGLDKTVGKVFDAIKGFITNPIEAAKRALQPIVDFIANLLGFKGLDSTTKAQFENVSKAITGPIEAAKGLVGTLTSGIQGFIDGIHGKSVDISANDKTRPAIESAMTSIKTLTGKTIDLRATEEITGSVERAKRALATLQNKTVNIQFHGYQSGIKGVDVTTYTTAVGNKRIVAEPVRLFMEAGGIVTKATAAIFGEAGDEAVIPLSNRNRVRPFARAVAAEIPSGSGGFTVNVYEPTFNNGTDIDMLAERINQRVSRQMAGAFR